MKKLPLSLLLIFIIMFAIASFALADVALNEANFPNQGFRTLLGNYDENNNAVLEDSEILKIKQLLSNANAFTNFENYIGIEHLTSLNTLNIENTNTSLLDLSKNINLEKLKVESSNINQLSLPQSIEYFSIGYSTITNYTNSNLPNLTYININKSNYPSNNFFIGTEALDTLYISESIGESPNINLSNNNNLKSLLIYGSNIQSINLPNNPENLAFINLDNNSISVIDLSNCQNTIALSINDNKLNQINLSNLSSLQQLMLNNNNLSSINLNANTFIENLELSNNKLSNIDLSQNLSLRSLNISNNSFKTLNLLHLKELRSLLATNNQLTDLKVGPNISVLYFGKNKLQSIDLSNLINLAFLECSYNQLTSINLSPNLQSPYWFLQGFTSMPQKRVITLDDSFANGKYKNKQPVDVLISDIDSLLQVDRIILENQEYTDYFSNSTSTLHGLTGTTLSADKLSFKDIKDGTIVKYYYQIPLPPQAIRSTLASKDSPMPLIGEWAILAMIKGSIVYVSEFEVEFKTTTETSPIPTPAATPTASPIPTATPTNPPIIQAPQTGDNSLLWLYSATLLIAIISIIIIKKRSIN